MARSKRPLEGEKTSDELFPKLLLITTFLGVTTMLFWMITPIIQTGTMMNDPSMDWSEIGIYGYAYYDPDPFEVSNASVEDHRDNDNYAVEFTSTVPHRHDIRAWVIRDNFWYAPLDVGMGTRYKDYFAFQMDLESVILKQIHKTKTAAISFETVVEKADYVDNSSSIGFTLNADYTLVISTGPGMLISDGLWMNEFNMSIGWPLNLSASASASPWGLIGQILTFSIPNVSPLINLLIGVPIYMTIGFLVVAVISRFVPLTSGL